MHLPRIGAATEQGLWARGIITWDELEAYYEREPALFPDFTRDRRVDVLRESRDALSRTDVDYFAKRLPSREHYRIAATFPNDTVFLDIETTGLSIYYDRGEQQFNSPSWS